MDEMSDEEKLQGKNAWISIVPATDEALPAHKGGRLRNTRQTVPKDEQAKVFDFAIVMEYILEIEGSISPEAKEKAVARVRRQFVQVSLLLFDAFYHLFSLVYL